ncbi:MAG TPA: hypothetical protein VFT74_12535, partial [Isosphaeraceae bacterium]|nr:hypothetical protein [Isosphaeraceae bacterium]
MDSTAQNSCESHVGQRSCETRSVKTSFDNNGLLIENPEQRLSDEVTRALVSRRATHLNLLTIARENDLTAEMRQASSDLRRRLTCTGTEPGAETERLVADLQAAARKRGDEISTILKDRIKRREQLLLTANVRLSDLLKTLTPEPV